MTNIHISNDSMPRLRLAELEFRIEVLEAAVTRLTDELELLATKADDARRQREAWDGR